MKKPYLITVSVVDGIHTHTYRAIYWAKTMNEAEKWAESQCAGHLEMDKKTAYFGYGDGLTATELESIAELPVKFAKELNTRGIAYSVNGRA